MNSTTLHAITLRRFDSGESDRRIVFLTQEAGVLVAFARGVRKANSKRGWLAEPLTVARIQVEEGRTSKSVTQAEPITSFPGIRSDFDRLGAALSLVELFAALVPEGSADAGPYDLLLRILGEFERHPRPVVAWLWGVDQLLLLEGLLPIWDACVVCHRPIRENPAWFSTSAGGNLCTDHFESKTARLEVRAEVLIGLAQLVQRETPPGSMKFAEEAARLVRTVVSDQAERRLPATEAFVRSLHLASGSLDSGNLDAR